MAAPRIEDLLERVKKPREERDMFMALMRDCYAMAMPERDGWNSYGLGQNRSTRVFDSTAISSVPRFCNRLQQALFPPGQRWAALGAAPGLVEPEKLTESEIPKTLEAVTALLFSHLQVSGFDNAIHEWAHDLVAGSGCLLIENGRLHGRPTAPLFRVQAVPSHRLAWDEGPFGMVEGIFFDQELAGRQVLRTYPDASLPQALQQQVKAKPQEAVTLLQATTYDAEEDCWWFQVILEAQSEQLVKRRFRTCPWVVTRWTKAPGETRGRGPLTQALPDIRTMNKIKELLLRQGALEITGVYTGRDDGVLNPSTVRLVPGAIIPVQSNGGPMGPSLSRLPSGGPLNLTQLVLSDMVTSVRQILFDNPLPPEVEAGLTATEIVERIRQFQQDTGAFGRLTTEAVQPIIRRCIDILEEAGELADPVLEGLSRLIDAGTIRIVPISPLAQVQNRADVAAVQDFARLVGQMGDIGLQLLKAGLKLDDLGPYLAEKIGVPAHLIPTAADQAADAEAAARQQQEQALLSSPAVAQVAGQVARGAVDAAMPRQAAG